MILPLLRRWSGVELIEVSHTEKIVSALGGGVALLVLVGLSSLLLPSSGSTAVVASMGASAALLFAVPHAALSQPWPVLGGHLLSALAGVICAQTLGDTALAAGCAVGAAIAAMLVFRCIHPPGGATALTAVLGGSAIHDLGFHYIIMPVLVNTLALLLLAMFINFFFPWRRYPAAFNRPASPPSAPSSCTPGEPTHEEVIAALRSLDSFVDVTEEDLLRLLALLRLRPAPDVSTTGSS